MYFLSTRYDPSQLTKHEPCRGRLYKAKGRIQRPRLLARFFNLCSKMLVNWKAYNFRFRPRNQFKLALCQFWKAWKNYHTADRTVRTIGPSSCILSICMYVYLVVLRVNWLNWLCSCWDYFVLKISSFHWPQRWQELDLLNMLWTVVSWILCQTLMAVSRSI